MAKSGEWNVLEHGPIEPLSENLWRVEGALPRMSLRRVMTIVRLADGRLVIHNAIAMDQARMAELVGLGVPSFMLVPSGMHRLDAPAYKRRFPDLRVFTPSGSRAKVAQVVAVDGNFADFPSDAQVELCSLPGTNDVEGSMLVRSNDGVTVVLNDAVFNMDRKRDALGWFFTTLLGSAPGPRVSRFAKLLLVKDRAALRAELERLAALPGLVRLIVSHEKLASGADAAAALRQAATYL